MQQAHVEPEIVQRGQKGAFILSSGTFTKTSQRGSAGKNVGSTLNHNTTYEALGSIS